MITIAQFLNPEEARVARSYLSANGVNAIIAGEESLSVMPHIGMGAKCYQLMVREEDEAMTRSLLAQVENDAPEEEPDKKFYTGSRHWLRVLPIFIILAWILAGWLQSYIYAFISLFF